MRATAFSLFAIGFGEAVGLVALAPGRAWIFWVVSVFVWAIAFCVPSRWRMHGIAHASGFMFAVARIIFLPDVLSVPLPALGALEIFVRGAARAFSAAFGRLYPEPIASFAQGILTGSAGARLDPLFLQALRQTSTLHLIAVSGYNVTLVASYAYKLFEWATMPRKMIWIFVLTLLAFFTVFVGAPASAVRAGIMASLAVIAARFSRPNAGSTALVFAAAAMLFVQPSVILDLGFQLSFLAAFGVIFVAPVFMAPKEEGAERESGLRSLIVETCAAQGMVVPVILYRFGTLSVIGLAANFVVVPLIPIAMTLAALSGFGFLLFEPLGKILAFASAPFFLFITRTIQWFGSLPFASLSGIDISLFGAAAYYAIILVWISGKMKNRARYV